MCINVMRFMYYSCLLLLYW